MLSPNPRGWSLELKIDMLTRRLVRHVIADIYEAAIRHSSHQIDSLVHPAAKPIDKWLRWRLVHAQKCVSMHPFGWLDVRQAQHGWGKVHEADWTGGLAAGPVFR